MLFLILIEYEQFSEYDKRQKIELLKHNTKKKGKCMLMENQQ